MFICSISCLLWAFLNGNDNTNYNRVLLLIMEYMDYQQHHLANEEHFDMVLGMISEAIYAVMMSNARHCCRFGA